MSSQPPRGDRGIPDDELRRHLARRADAARTGDHWTQTQLLPAVRARMEKQMETTRPRIQNFGVLSSGAAVVIALVIGVALFAGLPGPRTGPGPVGATATPIDASTGPTPAPTERPSDLPTSVPTVPSTIGPSTGPTPSTSPEPTIDPPVGAASWELPPGERPAGAAMTVQVLVTERSCASGRSPEGRIVGPTIVYRPDAIEITFGVRRLPGGQDCQGNPPFEVTVELTEPVGERLLLDGGATPPESR